MWWLSVHMRRLIAAILLLLDFSQEPASGVSFAELSDSDPDTIAELCTKENFSWSVAAAVENAAPSSRDVVHGSPRFEQRSDWNDATLASGFTAAAQSFDISWSAPVIYAAVPDLPPRDASVHRNTALAHKRAVVLII
jgi:hypothetical protein